MIETPQSSIKPEQELARLTLETDSVKERMRRRSTLMSDRPSLGHIDSIPMLGPLTLAEHERIRVTDDVIVQSPTEGDNKFFDPLVRFDEPESERKDTNDNIEPDVEDITMHDNSSEATLVSRPDSDQVLLENPSEGQQQPVSDDKENMSPIKPSPSVTTSLPQNAEPLAPASPSKLNAQAGANEQSAAPQEVNTEPEPVKYEPPPGKPPPVPPRKPNQDPTTTLEEYARQQDVTEVMNHCIIQLSCAMRPRGYDKSGEQYDEVHDLFFGQQVVHVQPEKGPSPNVPFLNIITRVYHQPPNVYAAMDNEYDLQDAQDGTKAYTSVARLPPVLTIALDRVDWNQEAKRQEKLNHHVDVPETIYMDRYLESASDSDLLNRRQQTWEMKKELAALSVRRTFLEEKHVRQPINPIVL